MRNLSFALAALTGLSLAPAATAQQTRAPAANSGPMIIVDCIGAVTYGTNSAGAPTVRCATVPNNNYSSQTFDMTQPDFQSFGLSQASTLSTPSWILYARGSEGVCGLSFVNPTHSGEWPDQVDVMFWSNADIAARRQPREVQPADLQDDAPNCTRNLLAFHDRVMDSLNPRRR